MHWTAERVRQPTKRRADAVVRLRRTHQGSGQVSTFAMTLAEARQILFDLQRIVGAIDREGLAKTEDGSDERVAA